MVAQSRQLKTASETNQEHRAVEGANLRLAAEKLPDAKLPPTSASSETNVAREIQRAVPTREITRNVGGDNPITAFLKGFQGHGVEQGKVEARHRTDLGVEYKPKEHGKISVTEKSLAKELEITLPKRLDKELKAVGLLTPDGELIPTACTAREGKIIIEHSLPLSPNSKILIELNNGIRLNALLGNLLRA
jgi:hypothetical protein